MRLDVWIESLESKGLRVNVRKIKIISSENAKKVRRKQVYLCCLQKGWKKSFHRLPALQVLSI